MLRAGMIVFGWGITAVHNYVAFDIFLNMAELDMIGKQPIMITGAASKFLDF